MDDMTLCLSWRVIEGSDRRDARGRLYSAFEPIRVQYALTATLLMDEQSGSASSGKLVRRIIARKQKAER